MLRYFSNKMVGDLNLRQQAIDLDPRYIKAYHRKACAEIKLEKFEEAHSSYLTALGVRNSDLVILIAHLSPQFDPRNAWLKHQIMKLVHDIQELHKSSDIKSIEV